jgi:hypothetical protein
MIREGNIRHSNLNWIDHLEDYIYNRNHSKHGTTKYQPVQVWKNTNEDNDNDIDVNTLKKKVVLNDDEIQAYVGDKLKQKAIRAVEKNKSMTLTVGLPMFNIFWSSLMGTSFGTVACLYNRQRRPNLTMATLKVLLVIGFIELTNSVGQTISKMKLPTLFSHYIFQKVDITNFINFGFWGKWRLSCEKLVAKI